MKIMVMDAPLALLRALSQRPEIELIVADKERVVDTCRAAELRCEYLPYRTRAKFDLSAIWRLRRGLARLRPDIIHAFQPRSLANSVVASAGLKPRPRIVSFRGIETTPHYLDPANHVTFLSPRVELHACESNAVRDGLVRGGVSAEKCVTVYNCVQPEYPRPGRPALSEFGIPEDAFVVGTIATIRPVKGIDILLDAATRCGSLPNTYFLLMGEIRDPRVQEMIFDPRIRERVRVTGNRTDAVSLISGADLFVMPSRQEGLCRALLEAMTQGVCPVVSSAGGMKEVVRDGIDGVVFPKEDPDALAGVIQQLHGRRELIQTYAASARQRVVEMCSAERMCERTLTIYRRLAA